MRVGFSDIHPTLYVVSPRWKRLDSAVWPRLGSSLIQTQSWTTVRESYSRALEEGPLLQPHFYPPLTRVASPQLKIGQNKRRRRRRRRKQHVRWKSQQRELTALHCAVLGGAATCSEGFVICFLKVPLACLFSMAATGQPNTQYTIQPIAWELSENISQNLRNKWPPHLVRTAADGCIA